MKKILIALTLFCSISSPNNILAATGEQVYVKSVNNYIDDYPYGKSNLRHNIYLYKGDGSDYYDFWTVSSVGQTVPGKVLNNNSWVVEAAAFGTSGCSGASVVDTSYSGTQYGPKTITDTVGFTAGIPTGGASMENSNTISTVIPDSLVQNQSDFSIEKARWSVQLDNDYKKNTYEFKHMVNYRVKQNASLNAQTYNKAIFDSLYGTQRERVSDLCFIAKKPF